MEIKNEFDIEKISLLTISFFLALKNFFIDGFGKECIYFYRHRDEICVELPINKKCPSFKQFIENLILKICKSEEISKEKLFKELKRLEEELL